MRWAGIPPPLSVVAGRRVSLFSQFTFVVRILQLLREWVMNYSADLADDTGFVKEAEAFCKQAGVFPRLFLLSPSLAK